MADRGPLGTDKSGRGGNAGGAAICIPIISQKTLHSMHNVVHTAMSQNKTKMRETISFTRIGMLDKQRAW